MKSAASIQAENFVKNEKEFHLGDLPTEQSNPTTRNLSESISQNIADGIRLLQKVDRDIEKKLPTILHSKEWKQLCAAMKKAMCSGKRICFSGCGATGRVSIMLEAAYRFYRNQHPEKQLPDCVCSLMTGGDYALVRSVESFEDYAVFGRRQLQDSGIGKDDVLVAITEGGETSSVIGTAWQALENGAQVFFVCNNPLDILAKKVTRSREIIEEARITKIDLSTGPMAIAGSTRMQATTFEIIAVGSALENAIAHFLNKNEQTPEDLYIENFRRLLDELGKEENIAAIAEFTAIEEEVYRNRGAITYFADRAMLDIFTDTTERAPTFMLPPFRKCDNPDLPRSWAFVKNPLADTTTSWEQVFQRSPKCLEWTPEDYKKMGASESIIQNPPLISLKELHKFEIGNESDPSRTISEFDTALLIAAGDESEGFSNSKNEFLTAFEGCTQNFAKKAILTIGGNSQSNIPIAKSMHISCSLPESPLRLWEHLALKLVLNTVSTATMARLGRVAGNWMAYVETSNKKLIDRGTRLIAELACLPYPEACLELFTSIEELKNWSPSQGERPSPVAYTIKRLSGK